MEGPLLELETKHDVVVLFAFECGSRAWGLDSAVSDHDVRFVFARHALDDPELPAVIAEQQGPYDLQGWSLAKAAALLRGRNGALAEWLASPALFVRDEGLLRSWRALVLHELPLCYHGYLLGLLKAERRRHLGGRRSVVLAEYLHAARPALMLHALLRDGTHFPPCSFETLLDICDDAEAVAYLRSLAQRKRSQELRSGEEGPHSAAVDRFFDRLEAEVLPSVVPLSVEMLADLRTLAARTIESASPAPRVVRVGIVLAAEYRDSAGGSYGDLCFDLLARACHPRRGVRLEGPRVWEADKEELPDASQFDLLILPGSPHAAYEDIAWTQRLLVWLAEIVAAERIPVLGICHGEQCVAQVGTV
jgi:predicted nucleotidyltransferase